MTNVRQHYLPALLSLTILLAGCGDKGTGPPPGDDPMEIIAGGVRAALRAAPFGGGYQDATIEIAFDDFPLSSYEGELSFDSQVFELLDIGTPDSDFHIVNALEVDAGHLRFAGFSAKRFEKAIEIELRFRTDRPITADDYALKLNIAASELDEPLPEQRIVVHGELLR